MENVRIYDFSSLTFCQSSSVSSFIPEPVTAEMGWIGGYYDHEDNAALTVLFQDSSGGVLGSATIGQVSVSDRDRVTGLLFQDTQGFLPTDTRQIEVLLEMNRVHGAYNDGYADNLSLVLVPLPSSFILLGTGILAMRRYQRIWRRPRRVEPERT